MKGEIAQSDAEAAKAVGSELLELIREMEDGVSGMNVKDIREAASKAKKLIAMVDETTAKLVGSAVEQAREIATELRKSLDKGERGVNEAREVVQKADMTALSKAREALDVVDLDQPEVVVAPVAEVASDLDLDLGETEEEESVRLSVQAQQEEAEAIRSEREETKAAADGGILGLEV